MKLAYLPLVFCLVSTTYSVFAQNTLPDSTQTLLSNAKIEIDVPEGYVYSGSEWGMDMSWNFALKHPEERFEIRYYLMDLSEMKEEYEESLTNPDVTMANPNNMYKSISMAALMNISGGDFPSIEDFNTEAVKEEFNADAGCTAFITPKESIKGGYQYCLSVTIHRDNLTDLHIFYLFDSPETLESLVKSVFHHVRFID